MRRSVILTAVSGLHLASAIQIPLFLSSQAQEPITHGSKELVSSSAIQELISSDNLLKRANQLYEIAQLGEDEYNHPTRVIGSKGTI
jgi:aminopeptidase Y